MRHSVMLDDVAARRGDVLGVLKFLRFFLGFLFNVHFAVLNVGVDGSKST